MKSPNRNKDKSGAIMFMTAAVSTLLLGIAAIVVDIGYIYYKRNELQSATNAGWLAGYDRLQALRSRNPNLDEEAIKNIKAHITEVMENNDFYQNESNQLTIVVDNNRELQVTTNSHVGLFFARIINVDSTQISSQRSKTTELGTIDTLPFVMAHGVTKWNADKSLSVTMFPKNSGFMEGQEYILKPGQMSEASVLCQGITDFSIEGTDNSISYESNLTNGLTKNLNINAEIGLACTGFAKETNNGLQARLSAKDTLKKVIVAIAEPTAETALGYGVAASQLPIYNLRSKEEATDPSQVKLLAKAARLTGFAEFELLDKSEYKRTGNDYADGDAGTLGAPTEGQLRGRFVRYIVNPNEIN